MSMIWCDSDSTLASGGDDHALADCLDDLATAEVEHHGVGVLGVAHDGDEVVAGVVAAHDEDHAVGRGLVERGAPAGDLVLVGRALATLEALGAAAGAGAGGQEQDHDRGAHAGRVSQVAQRTTPRSSSWASSRALS
jgi:hypothetical protein